jgi:alpha-1,2-glucosyltransferase
MLQSSSSHAGRTWLATPSSCLRLRLLRCRYFTVPFVLLALHMAPPEPWQLAATGAGYAAVDAATVYMFLFRPFAWPDGSVARFMW